MYKTPFRVQTQLVILWKLFVKSLKPFILITVLIFKFHDFPLVQKLRSKTTFIFTFYAI